MPPSLNFKGRLCVPKIKIRPSRFGFGVPFGLGFGVLFPRGRGRPRGPSLEGISLPSQFTQSPFVSRSPFALPVMLSCEKETRPSEASMASFAKVPVGMIMCGRRRFVSRFTVSSVVVVSFDSFLVYRCRGE